MKATRALLLVFLALSQAACTSLSAKDEARVETLVAAARSANTPSIVRAVCGRDDTCARPSPLLDLGFRAAGQTPVPVDSTGVSTTYATTPAVSFPDAPPLALTSALRRHAPQHYALILDYGQDALLARLDLIRGATRSIDVQTYIFDEDDAGHLVLDELLLAARRGVKVRLLVDQLAALRRIDTLAALAGAHANFDMRLYNPVLGRARINYPMYALASACCWRKLNQRMHNKLMLVDGRVAITGGRNYQNDYYDWDATYNFRDRDILVAGPAIADMTAHFNLFWTAPRSKPLTRLVDVGRLILRQGVPAVQHPQPEQPQRIERISRDADDAALVRSRLVDAAIPVRSLRYIGDAPGKHAGKVQTAETPSQLLRELIVSAEDRVLLQTPYLVLSKPAQRLFTDLQRRASPPRVVVSTNSLAATDAFIPYALSYKYKRRYLRDFKFEIYEFKPFPQDAPIDVDATGTVGVEWHADGTAVVLGSGAQGAATQGAGMQGSGASGAGRRRSPDRPIPLAREYSVLRYSKRGANEQVPLQRGGVRFGLHAKSMVIDARVAVIGTHNFDPRGENYNTESVVVIEDPAFAQLLAASIERDIQPANAWMIARRDKPPVFAGLEFSLAKVSELLPLFDFWPVRYATSYEFTPGPDCPQPISPRDPHFRRCYTPVGDFPEVAPAIRPLTRIFTAFGAGLAPIL